MLYNSFPFIFIFLPVCLIGFVAFSRLRTNFLQLLWLVAMSCAFYAYWNPIYLVLLLGSLSANFAFAQTLVERKSKSLLTGAIVLNLSVLAFFKYRAFAIANLSAALHLSLPVPEIVLPLGISFFTFQKIAYLIDIYRGRVKETVFLRYATFITFFPQLISGPIVHYRPMMQQIPVVAVRTTTWLDLNAGLVFFVVGLAKKVLIADALAPYADTLFVTAPAIPLGFSESWLAVLIYAFQIYFDFSGYSDMAVGLARMFGIRLPINFNSPYKAASIIDFWHRWHITLSQFLRDYVYIPLGGSRHGRRREILAIAITMLLGGLWHGAAWTFVAWGGVHGIFLAVNHLWRMLVRDRFPETRFALVYHHVCMAMTFLTVSAAWALFRSQTLYAGLSILSGLVGLNGFAAQLPDTLFANIAAISYIAPITRGVALRAAETNLGLLCIGLLLFSWTMPNSAQLLAYRIRVSPLARKLRWRPNPWWYCVLLLLFFASLTMMAKNDIRPFTYFAF